MSLEQTLVFFQFQMVADLFLDKDDAPPSSKPSRVNVRALKSTPKAPNKEHRKSVGLQVSWQVSPDPGPSGVWTDLCLGFSSARLCTSSWTR